MKRLGCALVGAGAAALVGAGCARTVVGSPLNTGYSSGNVAAELGFMEDISKRTVVANDEGLHALFALADAGDRNRTYEERVDVAKSRGWLSKDWDEPGDLAMQRGTLARCMVVMCRIQGGVMLRVLGPTARYATRELVYLDILPQGTEEQTLSGPELVGALNKAQDFLRLRAAREREGGGAGAGAGGDGRDRPG
jgi:hypothetical protein